MKRLLYWLVPVVVIALLIVWRLSVNHQVVAAAAHQQQLRMKTAPNVQVAVAGPKEILHTFESIGSVEAPFTVRLAPKLPGRIDYLQVREGDHVTTGEVLVRIDPSEIDAQVHQQEAAVAEAQQKLAQAQITQNPTNVNVQTQIQQQQAGVNTAKANAYQTETNYEAQIQAAQAAVTDAQGKVDNAAAAVRNAQASLSNSRAHYNRLLALYNQGYSSSQDLEDSRTAVDVANGQLGAAQAAKNSAVAEKGAAEKQLSITRVKGQADIDAAKAAVSQANAALTYAQANTAQTKAYIQNLAALRSEVAAAQASLKNARAQRANTVLNSSVDGFVTARYMDPGTMASAGQTILVVEDMRQVWATVPVPTEYNGKIALGQMTQVKFDAFPGRTFNGRITQMNPAADPISRQFSVRVTLDNPGDLIKPGSFARVTFTTERLQAPVAAPREAVQTNDQGSTVTVVGDGSVAHVRPVTTGASDATNIEIKDGVQPGEKLIIMSASPIKDGAKVRIGGAGGPRGPAGRS